MELSELYRFGGVQESRIDIMSKHCVLTAEEFSQFTPRKRTIHYIELYRKQKNLNKNEMNILDWGCGRGRDVLWLRENGYNAYGIDVDMEPIQNGIGLFQEKGYNTSLLQLLSSSGKTDFPDEIFHFTFSNQVFEHISDIKSVVAEIARITKNGGMGFHVYPAHRYITEGHLMMPLIHWLPKNCLRKYLISAFVLLSRKSHWSELKEKNFQDKVDTYYEYSIHKTFYRNYPTVKRTFNNNGFDVRTETIDNPKVRNNKFVGVLIKFSLLKFVINYLLNTFKRVELLITKTSS